MRAALLALLVPSLALADVTPLSKLPEKPVRYGQAAGPIPATAETEPSFYRVTGKGASVCFIEMPVDYWIDGDTASHYRVPELMASAREPFGIERLVVRDDKAELERISAEAEIGKLVPLARSRITLTEVAKIDGVVVYAYRWANKIFLLARTGPLPLPREAIEAGIHELPPTCNVQYLTLEVKNGASRAAQLEGTVPATGKLYLIDASVSQSGRDPEPLLAVTVRLLGK